MALLGWLSLICFVLLLPIKADLLPDQQKQVIQPVTQEFVQFFCAARPGAYLDFGSALAGAIGWDGVFEPTDRGQPCYVLEVQGFPNEVVYWWAMREDDDLGFGRKVAGDFVSSEEKCKTLNDKELTHPLAAPGLC
jgi:hypothetical protein